MEFKDLISLYFERSNALETLWTIYITVAVGLLAFLGTAKLKPPRLPIVGAIVVVFLGFAYFNCDALRSVTRQRHAAADLIRNWQFQDKDSTDRVTVEKLAATLDASEERQVIRYHAAADGIAVVAFILLVFKKKAEREPSATAASLGK